MGTSKQAFAHFKNFRAHRAFARLEICGHGQGFWPMPYGMPHILGIFAGMSKRVFALFGNLLARALWTLDF